MATKEKTAKKTSNKSGEHYDLSVLSPGVVTVEGVVKDNTSKVITLNRKRDGSSKRMIEAIPKGNIIFVLGALDIGANAKITYRDERAPAMRKLRRVVIEGADKDTGMFKGQNEKGEPILVALDYAKLTSSKDSEIEEPAGSGEKKKKSSKKA